MSKKKKTIEELLEETLVSEEKQLYEIPENWIWLSLKNSLNSIQYGYTETSSLQAIGPKFLRITDIQNDKVDWSAVPYCKITEKEFAKYKLEDNDIVVARTGATTGKSYLIDKPPMSVFASYLIRLRCNDIMFPRFLWEFMKSPVYWKQITVVKKGSAQPGANAQILGNLSVPLPPLQEQKRITEKVEGLLGKIEEAKQLIEEAKETFELRRAAILDKAFRGELTRKWREEHPDIENAEVLYDKIISLIKPKKFEIIEEQSEYIPCKWKWVRLGEVVQVNPPKKKLNEVSEEQKCTFIPMPAVSDKTGKIEEPEEREYRKVKKGYTFFLENDVLFAKITPCMENGKSAIARQLKNGFGYGSTEFHVLRTSEYVNEQYIHYLVRSQRFRAKAKREMTGAVGQQRVPKEFLLNYPFPLPPKKEQDAIVNILDDIFAKDNCSKFNLQLESELDILKQCILSKAFRGELGTNDPSEESAVELLKEVLQEQVK
ncbi:restriction endonuclease subunit S [Bacillus velezensis]|uniref:restriction endonuclease subunit S n=1 Tax=Bacillus velezensis TaxID=492670 RepID=UPI003D3212E8